MDTPIRTCVGCRKAVPATELARFVLVGGELVPDPGRRAFGRGAWLHLRRQCVAQARRRGGFARSFRSGIDDSILDGLGP